MPCEIIYYDPFIQASIDVAYSYIIIGVRLANKYVEKERKYNEEVLYRFVGQCFYRKTLKCMKLTPTFTSAFVHYLFWNAGEFNSV